MRIQKNEADPVLRNMRRPAPCGHERTEAHGGGKGLYQRTLETTVHCSGIGLHSGQDSTLTLNPAPAGSGVVFIRTDLGNARIPARYDSVSKTRLCTVLSGENGAAVSTVEHIMSALSGMGIDNARIEVNAGEVPAMDGSAAPFVFLIQAAGVKIQPQLRHILRVLKTVCIEEGDALSMLEPSDNPLSLSFEIDFASRIIGRQAFSTDCETEEDFIRNIAPARTYGFVDTIDKMRKGGWALGGSLNNAIVIGKNGVVNQNGLRFKDEFVRHKVLDAIGDLYLAGGPMLAHFTGRKSGHAMTNRLLRKLFSDPRQYRWEWAGQSALAALPVAE